MLLRTSRVAFHLAAEGLQRGGGRGAVPLAQNHEAGFTLDQGAHRGAVEGALDQVSLPVAGDQAGLYFLGSMDNT